MQAGRADPYASPGADADSHEHTDAHADAYVYSGADGNAYAESDRHRHSAPPARDAHSRSTHPHVYPHPAYPHSYTGADRHGDPHRHAHSPSKAVDRVRTRLVARGRGCRPRGVRE